jgi:acyl-CoA hydrolase
MLMESGAKELGVHSEMLTEGMIELYRAGRITNSCKALNPGKMVFSFTLGSPLLYSTIDRNSDFLCCPVDQINPPHIIMQNDRVVAINNTTQVDLQGQAA